MEIRPGDLDDPRVRALIAHHAETARAETARDSAHAMDPDTLRTPDIALWSVWDGETLLGIGALRTLTPTLGEIKAMHTIAAARRTGAGGRILLHLIAEARAAGLERVSLETGSWPYFAPARVFYARHGFVACAPFGDYRDDPNSVFMTRVVA
jgi:putative acetyltransferase